VKEARAWLEAMAVLSDDKTLRARFLSAGVQCEHRGNIDQLYRTTQANFFQLNDPVALELQTALEERFRLLEKPVPMVRVISVVGIPPNERAYKEYVAQLKAKKQNPMTLGLPSRLRDSQFFDGASKSIPPSCFFYACPLDEIGEAIYVITINTDYHGEIKSRGIHAGVSTVMSRAEVLSAHASCAILNSAGTGTVFLGASGAGKTEAATFWAHRPKTPLAIDPLIEELHHGNAEWTVNAANLPELDCYVDCRRIPALVGETDIGALWSNLRPMGLNYWFTALNSANPKQELEEEHELGNKYATAAPAAPAG
jgi:hypothetical protein